MIIDDRFPTVPLLPLGSSELERKAEEVLQFAVRNPIIIAELINPETLSGEFFAVFSVGIQCR